MNQFKMLKPEEAARRAKENVERFKREEARKAFESRGGPLVGKPAAKATVKAPRSEKMKLMDEYLLRCVLEGEKENVERLLKEGADPNAAGVDGRSALMFAAEYGKAGIAKLLIDAKADVDAKDNVGVTALMLAARNDPSRGLFPENGIDENELIVKMLIDAGADVNIVDELGYTALMIALSNEKEKIARLLVEAGSNVDARDKEGVSVLMHAAGRVSADFGVFLIGSGAEVNARDNKRKTALMRAAEYGFEDGFAEALLKAGAEVDATEKDGSTALMWAAASGNDSVIESIIAAGADLEAKDSDGRTALMSAAGSGNVNAVCILIEKGANLNAKDYGGKTALEIAKEYDDSDEVAKILSEEMAKLGSELP